MYNRDVMFREVKDVIQHEVQPKEPKKIEFELKEEESDSAADAWLRLADARRRCRPEAAR